MNTTLEIESYGQRVSEALSSSKYDEVLLYCRRAIKANPKFHPAYMGKIQALKFLKKYKTAKTELRNLIQEYLNTALHWEFLFELADLFLKQKKYKKAKKTFKRVSENSNEITQRIQGLGIDSMMKEEYEIAKVYFGSICYKSPRKYDSQIGMGFCYFHQGKFELAKKVYKKAVLLKEESDLAKVNLSLILACEQKEKEAEEMFKNQLAGIPARRIQIIIIMYYKVTLGRAKLKLDRDVSQEEKALYKIQYDGLKFIMDLLVGMLNKEEETVF